MAIDLTMTLTTTVVKSTATLYIRSAMDCRSICCKFDSHFDTSTCIFSLYEITSKHYFAISMLKHFENPFEP